jgi:hypothetical protein
MQVKVAKNSHFSMVLFWVALVLALLMVSQLTMVYGIPPSNHSDGGFLVDEAGEQESSCGSMDCHHITYTHKHSSDQDNKEEHQHTHVIHLSHGEFPVLGAQPLQIDGPVRAMPLLLALALQAAFFPKEACASIFRPPIA